MGFARAQTSLRVAAGVLLLASWAAACGEDTGGPRVSGARLPVEWLVVGNHRITAEIAKSASERRTGLMHRESIPEDHGMLFIFPEERVRGFWMRNTSIPLSVAYADAGGAIRHIAALQPFQDRPVSSVRPARYALEMNRGWFASNGVRIGDRIAGIPR